MELLAEGPLVDVALVAEPLVAEPLVDVPFVDVPFVVEPLSVEPLIVEPVIDAPRVDEPFADSPPEDEPFTGKTFVDEPPRVEDTGLPAGKPAESRFWSRGEGAWEVAQPPVAARQAASAKADRFGKVLRIGASVACGGDLAGSRGLL